jgi:uncharacterized protein with HEPN domain
MSEHPDFVANHPDIPWRQMRGMRNRMAHGYFDINLEIVGHRSGRPYRNLSGNWKT